jgi:hypothetical protein
MWSKARNTRICPLQHWNHWFKSHLRHGCMAAFFFLPLFMFSCVGKLPCVGLTTRARSPTDCPYDSDFQIISEREQTIGSNPSRRRRRRRRRRRQQQQRQQQQQLEFDITAHILLDYSQNCGIRNRSTSTTFRRLSPTVHKTMHSKQGYNNSI